jgi:hypothetical protein
MKLYIPTCTLNFNNIFSTESISPAAFYLKRDFGIKRYYKVEANNLDNVVLLYTKYPHFNVSEGDMENSPLVLEIDTEDYVSDKFLKVQELDGVDVYASKSTIYFNPFHFKAFFRSWQDRQLTLTKAEQSLENKYSKLYNSSFVIRQEKGWSFSSLFTEKDFFEWNSSFVGDSHEIPLEWTNEDSYIDRLKGAVVCYLIGSNMAVSKEVSRLKQLARKMRNTLSAIVNSPDKRPTETQDNTLLSYIQEFNKIYYSLDENSLYNKSIINQRLVSPSTGLDKETIIKVLKDLRLEDAFKRQINLRPVYDANELYTCLDSPTMSPADASLIVIDRLFNAIKHIEIKEQSKSKKNELTELIKIEGKHIQIIDSLIGVGSYINKLLNSLINREYKQFMSENGTEELLSIAFVGGGKLKEYKPDKWEGSQYQAYINGLLANMQQGESFDLFSIDNVILQSFAAFCQKGEDIDRLSDYMLQCGFSEYRFALGLYGATRGFASLPKTFTSTLINGERSYYIEFYKNLYKWLFGIEIQNALLNDLDNDSIYYDSLDKPIPSTIMDNINKIEPKPSKQDAIVRAVSQTASLEDAVQSPRAFMFILDSLPNITRTKAYKLLKDVDFENDQTIYSPEEFRKKIYSIIGSKALKAQKENIDTAIELEAKRQDPDAFLKILDNFMDKSSSAYKKISMIIQGGRKEVHHKEEPLFDSMQNKQKTSYVGQSIFSLSHETFPNIPSVNRVNSNVFKRLEQNWKFTGLNYKDDRREHIKYFINLCKKEGRGESQKQTSLYNIFTIQLAEQIEKELLDYYGL